MMNLMGLILSSLSTLSVAIWLWFLTYQLRKHKDQLLETKRRLYLIDHNIKTLHSNQKALHSDIKEIRKDLLIYGEIKKSKTRSLFTEKFEENQNRQI